MRALTPSESRLLNFLGVVVVLLAIVFSVVYYLRTREAIELRIQTLQDELAESEIWLEERDLWERRREWVRAEMPTLPGDGSAASSLLQDMQDSASANGLEIASQSLTEPVDSSLFTEYSVRLKVQGTLEQLVKWLADVQSPDNFHAITAFNLKSDKEPPAVVCELQITRYYQPTNPT